jgi:hypothetical protein
MNIIQLVFITLVKFITWIFDKGDLAILELEFNDFRKMCIAREVRRATVSKWRTNTQAMNLFAPLYRRPGLGQTRSIIDMPHATQNQRMQSARGLWILNNRPLKKTNESLDIWKLEAERKILRKIVVNALVDFLSDGLRRVNISASE